MAPLADREEDTVEYQGRPTLLVATDSSGASLYAGERATVVVKLFGAKLFVLYVVDPDEAFYAGLHYGEAVREFGESGKEATAKIAALAEKGGVEHEELVAYFSDREPAVPYWLAVSARRTLHLRFSELKDPEPILADTDYAYVIESDVPIVFKPHSARLEAGPERAVELECRRSKQEIVEDRWGYGVRRGGGESP